MMGSHIGARRIPGPGEPQEYPPVTIEGGSLRGITYTLPVASAQVKSALLLAGLYAHGATVLTEPVPTRDHTERMLRLFGAHLTATRNRIKLYKTPQLISPGPLYIPGDISSAAFFIVAAAILPHSSLSVRKVSLNPGRLGFIRVLKRMGGRISISKTPGRTATGGEPVGHIRVESSRLKGIVVAPPEIPSLIDELPVLMVAACCARGATVFKGIGELRVKETDRIRSMCENLRAMGADIRVVHSGGSDDIIIKGPVALIGRRLRSFNDHRTAMSLVIAGLAAKGTSSIDDVGCIKKSFPDFLATLKTLLR
jgi:3-phosphoshikimate 1-carboxyvinyltransferase